MNLFLIGAGFNVDASGAAGPISGNSYYCGSYVIDCGYPLVKDTARICFGLSETPQDKSIEELFAEAAAQNNYEPLKKLLERLMEADVRLASRLVSEGSSNIYREFFQRFQNANFLTFNYDSLPEIILHNLNRWYPHDGYGLPVEVEMASLPITSAEADLKSTSLVLHLHGSFCLFTEIFGKTEEPGKSIAFLKQLPQPKYSFDPDATSSCFIKYRRAMSNLGHVPVEDRVIAPIPDKAESLKEPFIKKTYSKALSLINNEKSLIAVGYSFNLHDSLSYQPILETLAASSGSLHIIAPDSDAIGKRIASEFPQLKISTVEKTFKRWASDSFPL